MPKTGKKMNKANWERFRVKLITKEYTTISLEPELVELVKRVFNLNDRKEFINFLRELIDYGLVSSSESYSTVVRKKIYQKLLKRFEDLERIIQPRLID